MLLHSKHREIEPTDSSAVLTDDTMMTLKPGKRLTWVHPVLIGLFINASLRSYSGTHNTQKQLGKPI